MSTLEEERQRFNQQLIDHATIAPNRFGHVVPSDIAQRQRRQTLEQAAYDSKNGNSRFSPRSAAPSEIASTIPLPLSKRQIRKLEKSAKRG